MSEDRTYPTSHRFRADEIREGEPYELSNGYRIRCLPTGGRGSDAAATGAAVLKSDPAVTSAGVDTGYSPSPETLRAPDVAVGNVPVEPGWVQGVPPLAVEYADTGQHEGDLATKIHELLSAGTQTIWVVRLTGPRRVEIHEADREMRLARPGETLEAPGILQNPIPVQALYDWQIGQEVTLRNLLQRHGFDSLEAVQAESEARGRAAGEARGRAAGEARGRAEGEARALLAVLQARGLEPTEVDRNRILITTDPVILERWVRRAAVAESVEEVFAETER